MADREYTPELWTYGGVRKTSSGKRAAWYDASREALSYSATGTGGLVVGGVYEAQISRDGEHIWRDGNSLVYQGPQEDREWVAELQAADRIARTQLAAAAREKSDARTSALNDAIAPLEEIAAKFVDPADVDALALYVIRRLHEARSRARAAARKARQS